MFYEIRRYQTEPGRRDEWVRYMENVRHRLNPGGRQARTLSPAGTTLILPVSR
jgi:hypothetical protein